MANNKPGIDNGGSVDIEQLGSSLILERIPKQRSRMDMIENSDYLNSINQNLPKVQESFCHTFYRILGLPVINKDRSDFYNPGFLGNEDSTEQTERRENINKAQDSNLLKQEYLREINCDTNYKNFNNANDNLTYKLDTISYPIKINILNKNSQPFDVDPQEDFIENREKFQKTKKILRPFKCNAGICGTVTPIQLSLCAPFIAEQNAVVLNNKLSRTYLEYVCMIRFGLDVTNNSVDNKYKQQIQDTIENNYGSSGVFQEGINALTEIEAYIVGQLILSFVDMCKQVRSAIVDNQQVIRQINANYGSDPKLQLDLIQNIIKIKEQEKATKELILSQIPTNSQQDQTPLRNPVSCPLGNTFIAMVQNDLKRIEREIQELNNRKEESMRAFDSINKNIYYIIGENTGLGMLDITAIMISFWLISQEKLLAMLDGYSFKRMYRTQYLRNKTVKDRYEATEYSNSQINIEDVISEIDKNVYNLLDFASNIIEGIED